jgi:23S rRNA (cytosine1962-C5)-methyltransferase
MPATLPSVILRPGEADRIIAGHPWIYAGAIRHADPAIPDGALVAVKDPQNRFVGCGLFNSKSRIRVRVLASHPIELNQASFEQRLALAAALRKRALPHASSFRLVNAEGDQLSGLIVDRYEDVFVLQTSSLGMDRAKPLVLAVLQQQFNPRAIVERNDATFRKFEGMENANGVLVGSIDGPVPARLNGLLFEADVLAGHKTGLYLDQQVNYQLVASLIAQLPNPRVLDAFTFQGGFALHAARAGARRVLAIDQSQDALQTAQRLAQTNQLDDRCTFETANAFDWLKARTTPPPGQKLTPEFDAVILDPPSFTRTRAALPDALRGYKEIHLRALKLIKPGGILATFCCSHHVDARTFLDVILSAAFDARRVLRRTAILTQGPDHPVIPSIPETEYLKGYAFDVLTT